MDELQLLHRALNELRRSAFGQPSGPEVRALYEHLLPTIRRVVARACIRNGGLGQRADMVAFAEEQVQSIFEHLFERQAYRLCQWRPERGRRKLTGWVAMIAERRVLTAIRSLRRSEGPSLSLVEVEDPGPTVDELVTSRQQLRRIRERVVPGLAERDRRIFGLLFDERQTPRQIADELGMKLNTVHKAMSRIRERIRRAEDDVGGEVQ